MRRPLPGGHELKDRFFYGMFLPLGVLLNVGFGVLILTGLRPDGWIGSLQLGTGAFCCFVGGCLAAALWSKSYWSKAMARQVAMWHRISDVFFGWLEEAPVPAEAMRRLKNSLEETIPGRHPH